MDSEADRIVQRWVCDDRPTDPPPDDVACQAALATGRTIYQGFHDGFARFFQGERCPGVLLIERTVRRRMGYVDPRLVEETLHRILDRRLHLLEHFRQTYQPSMFAPCSFNAGLFTGYLRRVVHTETRPVELPPNPGTVPEPASHPPSPRQYEFDPDEADSYQHFVELIDRFWGDDNGFSRPQRWEGLVSLGLGSRTGDPNLAEQCRLLLEKRIGAWENERQAIRDWVSRLLARCAAARLIRLAAPSEAERREAEEHLQRLEDRLDRARQRLARHRTRICPRSADVKRMLNGLVSQPSLVRFRRIGHEIKIMRQRVERSRQGLTQAAEAASPVRQLGEDVARHIAAEPRKPRDRTATWVAEVGQILGRTRQQIADLYRAAPGLHVRRPVEHFLADVEDLYELGLLRRRGVIGGLGRRHGWRLEWLLRTADERRGE